MIWECGQRSGEVSSGTTDRREAERAAGRLEEQLLAGQFPGRSEGIAISWEDFRRRYEREWLEQLSSGSRAGWRTAANHFERICEPRLLIDIDKAMLSRFRAELETAGISPASAKSYYLALHAGLGWAADVVDLIETAPTIRLRKPKGRKSSMRSRPITGEEFERMIATVPKVRPRDSTNFERFLRGLWLSSLRIDELNRLRWELSQPLHVDLTGKLPLIVFLGAQKNGSDSYLPAPPEFWELVDRRGVPRRGHVFPMPHNNNQMQTRSIGRRISDIGRRAGVLVTQSGKHATAHDLRRGNLTALASRANLSQVQTIARHSDPKTTSDYYVKHDAETLAAALGWIQ